MNKLWLLGRLLTARSPRGIPFTWLATGGVALGVAILVITLAIIDGFATAYQDGLVRFHAPILIVRADERIDRAAVEAAITAHQTVVEAPESGVSVRWINRLRNLWWWGTGVYREWTWNLRRMPGLAAWIDRCDPQHLIERVPMPQRFMTWRRQWHQRVRTRAEHGVTAFGPFLYREALLLGDGAIRGVALRGMPPAQMSPLHRLLITLADPHRDLTTAFHTTDDAMPILLGSALAEQVGTEAVRLFVPTEGMPRSPPAPRPLHVVGTFTSGVYEFDSQFAFMDLQHLQAIYGLGAETITGYEVQVDTLDQSAWIADALRERLGPPYALQDWRELHRETFEAVAMEKILFGLIMGILVVIAGVNIVTALLLRMVLQYRSLAILHAIGFAPRDSRRLYFWHGAVIGTLGVLLGVGIGSAVSWVFGRWQWITIDPEIYFLSTVPVHLSIWTLGGVVLFGGAIVTLAASRAARRVADLPILQALGRGFM